MEEAQANLDNSFSDASNQKSKDSLDRSLQENGISQVDDGERRPEEEEEDYILQEDEVQGPDTHIQEQMSATPDMTSHGGPESSFDIVNNTTQFQRILMDQEEDGLESQSRKYLHEMEVTAGDIKVIGAGGVKNATADGVEKRMDKLHTQMHIGTTKKIKVTSDGPGGQSNQVQSTLNQQLSWQTRSPKGNFLDVVKEQLDSQRQNVPFFSKNPKNTVKGAKLQTYQSNNPSSMMGKTQHLHQQSQSLYSDTASISKDFLLDGGNLMITVNKQSGHQIQGVPEPLSPQLKGSPPATTGNKQGIAHNYDLLQLSYGLMREIQENNEASNEPGSTTTNQNSPSLFSPNETKQVGVKKVDVSFQGLDLNDRSAILGSNKPYAKMEAMARARQQRLSERNGNPLLEYLKKREEINKLAMIENSMNTLAAQEFQHQKSRGPFISVLHNKNFKQRYFSKTQNHSPKNIAFGSSYNVTSPTVGDNEPNGSTTAINSHGPKPSHQVYGGVIFGVREYVGTPDSNNQDSHPNLKITPGQHQHQILTVNDSTQMSFQMNNSRGMAVKHQVPHHQQSPVWLRGIPSKKDKQKRAQAQMLFPLEPPIDVKSKHYNHQAVRVDPEYLDATINQSKGVKVRASVSNYKANKYLACLQQMVNKDKFRMQLSVTTNDHHNKNQSLFADDLLQPIVEGAAAVLTPFPQEQSLMNTDLLNKTTTSTQESHDCLIPSSAAIHRQSHVKKMTSIMTQKRDTSLPLSQQDPQECQQTRDSQRIHSPEINLKPAIKQPCLAKLPPLKTRDISPRYNITVKNTAVNIRSSQMKNYNSPLKDVEGNQEIFMHQPSVNESQQTTTFGIGGSIQNPAPTIMTTSNIIISGGQALQTSGAPFEPMTSIYTNIQNEIASLGPQRYSRKPKLPAKLRNYNPELGPVGGSVTRKYHTESSHAQHKPYTEKFVGMGGFQRMLNVDFTFNHQEQYERGRLGIYGSPDESPVSNFAPSKLKKGAPVGQQNRVIVLSSIASTQFNESPEGQYHQQQYQQNQGLLKLPNNQGSLEMDLKGQKLTFSLKKQSTKL